MINEEIEKEFNKIIDKNNRVEEALKQFAENARKEKEKNNK